MSIQQAKSNKIIIYQVFTRLFGNDNTTCRHNGSIDENGCGKLSDFTDLALRRIKEKNFTHIWFTGLIEHATKTIYPGIKPTHPAIVKGNAGSPYSITDYYDIDPDLAVNAQNRMKEFETLVDRTHKNGLGVIIDFVPNHVSRAYSSDKMPKGTHNLGQDDDTSRNFSPYNNFYYLPGTKLEGQFDMFAGAPTAYEETPAKVTGNNRFDQYPGVNDWYETVKLNYGVDYFNGCRTYFDPTPDTWHKMLAILLFWAGKKIDGFRCDMAEMVPLEFWQWAIPQVKATYPHIFFIAEIYNPNAYRDFIHKGGFDYLYDKVGLYDTLRHIIQHGGHASDITRCWQQTSDILPHMLYFLENHDEQRIASDFFAGNPRKALPAFATLALMNTSPVMVYFGQEYGERGMDEEGFSGRDGRTTIFDYWCVDTIRRWRNGGKYDSSALTTEEKSIANAYAQILRIATTESSIREGVFFDLTYANFNNNEYDTSKLFAFWRKQGDEYILVIANFADRETQAGINMPQHAFDYLELPTGTAIESTDLLSGEKERVELAADKRTRLNIPRFGAKIIKFTKDK